MKFSRFSLHKSGKYSFIPSFFVKSTYCLSSQLTKHGEYFEISFWLPDQCNCPFSYLWRAGRSVFLNKKRKIIWLCLVLVAALGIFVVHEIFNCGMWDLVPWSRTEPGPSVSGVKSESLDHYRSPSIFLIFSPSPPSWLPLSLNPKFSLSLPKCYKSVAFL